MDNEEKQNELRRFYIQLAINALILRCKMEDKESVTVKFLESVDVDKLV